MLRVTPIKFLFLLHPFQLTAMNLFHSISGFAVFLSFLTWTCQPFELIAQSSNKESVRPNVIVIMADDLGFETITANGGQSYQTPEIDQMANRGIRFEQCYAQPLCTPSRVKIMTGINNVRNYVRFGLLDPSQTTFGHLFQSAGYATCIVGKWQLGKDPMSPRQAGFDEHCLWQVSQGRVDSNGRDTRFSAPVLETNGSLNAYSKTDFGPQIVANYGLDFIERSSKVDRPFLLYYPMILTHCPFSPTPDSPEWITDDTTVMKYKGQAPYFEDMVSYMDKIVGSIHDKLDELGIADNTVVIFTGDNGTDKPIVSMFQGREFAGAKGQSIDGGTHVPLVVTWPKQIEAGQVSQNLVDFSDVLPTICEAAQIAVPDSLDIDGHSFLPGMLGQIGQPREWVYNWYSRSGEVDKAKVFARNQRFKLYDTGEFYEVPLDELEHKSLDVSRLGEKEKAVHERLSRVLESYRERRLEDIGDAQ